MRAACCLLPLLVACAPGALEPIPTEEAPVQLTTRWVDAQSRDPVRDAEVCADGDCVDAGEDALTTFEAAPGADVTFEVDAPEYDPILVPLGAGERWDKQVEVFLVKAAAADPIAHLLPEQDPALGTIVLVVGRQGITVELDQAADGPIYTDRNGIPQPSGPSFRWGFVLYYNVEPGPATLRLEGAEGCVHDGWLSGEADYRLPIEAGAVTFLPDLVCDWGS